MSARHLLAIDAGTGSCRAVLIDSDGSQVAIAHREYSHPPAPGVPGSQLFDTTRNWQLICECVREALASAPGGAPTVAAVSATSMREGMVLYDTRAHEIWACPNADARALGEAAELVASGEAQEIYERAGDWVSITAPPRFRWIARHQPDVFESIAHVGMLGDWILTKLSGEFVTDPSLGSSSAMFDLETRRWSDRVIQICGLERTVFPEVVDAGTVIGVVTDEAAMATGLRAGTPVVTGGADTQLALLGLGVTEPGTFTVVGGSFWQQTIVLSQPLIDPHRRLRTLCHTVSDRWMMEGIGFYCGLVMRWFRDAFCDAEVAQAQREGVDAYGILERKAALVPPGSNGVFGTFSNIMRADHWVHASPGFLGFDVSDPARSGRAECCRAIEESAAYVSRGHLEIIQELAGLSVGHLILTGGAAKGTLWPQILADTLALPVQIPEIKESTALGAAIYAGVGVGVFDDPASAAQQINRTERTVEPRPDASATYTQLYERWRDVYARSLEISEAGLVRPLWRAPGT